MLVINDYVCDYHVELQNTEFTCNTSCGIFIIVHFLSPGNIEWKAKKQFKHLFQDP